MKLKKWALIAEIGSGIAVVVTLFFLIVGISENTNATRAAVYGDVIDGLNDLETMRLANPALGHAWRLFIRDSDVTSLEETERLDLFAYLQILIRNYEKAYYNSRYGVIGASEWNHFQTGICQIYSAAQRTELGLVFEIGGTNADFQAYVHDACAG